MLMQIMQLCSRCRPRINSAIIRRHFVKDVYLDLKYAAPFTEDEKNLALKTIEAAKNPEELNRAGISKVLANRIIKHKVDHNWRSFEVVEQLLDVNKMDVQQLENMIRRILKSSKPTEDKSGGHCTTPMTKLSQRFSPNVTFDRWMKLETVCSLKLSLSSLSFAKMNKDRELLEFDSVDLFDKATSATVLEYQKLYAKVVEVANVLPKSDIYVFEEISAILPKDPHLRLKVIKTSKSKIASKIS